MHSKILADMETKSSVREELCSKSTVTDESWPQVSA